MCRIALLMQIQNSVITAGKQVYWSTLEQESKTINSPKQPKNLGQNVKTLTAEHIVHDLAGV